LSGLKEIPTDCRACAGMCALPSASNAERAGKGAGPNLWKWASKLAAPEEQIEVIRKKFNFPCGKITVETAIILRLALEAIRGDMKAMEMWVDRKYGKVTQSLDV